MCVNLWDVCEFVKLKGLKGIGMYQPTASIFILERNAVKRPSGTQWSDQAERSGAPDSTLLILRSEALWRPDKMGYYSVEPFWKVLRDVWKVHKGQTYNFTQRHAISHYFTAKLIMYKYSYKSEMSWQCVTSAWPFKIPFNRRIR